MEDKNRLEALSDGIMAIIITIMVLNIEIPSSPSHDNVKTLLGAIFVFFISFMIVGTFWNQHRRLFENLKSINNKFMWRNLLFLFFLALVPVFTKWVTLEPDATIPVLSYGIMYLFVTLSYNFMVLGAVRLPKNYEIPENEKIHGLKPQKVHFMINAIIMCVLILVLTMISFYAPEVSAVLLMGFPLASAFFNLWFEYDTRDRHRIRRRSKKHKKNIQK